MELAFDRWVAGISLWPLGTPDCVTGSSTSYKTLPGESRSVQWRTSPCCLEARGTSAGNVGPYFMEQLWCVSIFFYRVGSEDERKYIKGDWEGPRCLLQLHWVIVGLGDGAA